MSSKVAVALTVVFEDGDHSQETLAYLGETIVAPVNGGKVNLSLTYVFKNCHNYKYQLVLIMIMVI